jgi:hypothetical protein
LAVVSIDRTGCGTGRCLTLRGSPRRVPRFFLGAEPAFALQLVDQRLDVRVAAGAYAVVGWLLAQVAGTLEEALSMPGWFDTVVVSGLLIGFPVAMIPAWAFDLTPEA